MGRIGDLVEVARVLRAAHPAEDLVVFKSDFKSACRGLPIRPSHKDFANVVLWHEEFHRLMLATQHAMPFGAVAAVYAWDRLADAIVHVLMVTLCLPIVRYVDGLFGVCFRSQAERVRRCIVELVSTCGFAIELEKPPRSASCQIVLGIQIEIVKTARRGRERVHIRASL